MNRFATIEYESEWVETAPGVGYHEVVSVTWVGPPRTRIDPWALRNFGVRNPKPGMTFLIGDIRVRLYELPPDLAFTWDGFIAVRCDHPLALAMEPIRRVWGRVWRPINRLLLRLGWAVGLVEAEPGMIPRWRWPYGAGRKRH